VNLILTPLTEEILSKSREEKGGKIYEKELRRCQLFT
jgi:hypothetical protein